MARFPSAAGREAALRPLPTSVRGRRECKNANISARVEKVSRVLDVLEGTPCNEQGAILRAAIELIEADSLSFISGRSS
jgi:hypothetical protein